MSTAELALFVACLALALDLIFVGLVLLVVAKLRPLIEQARPYLGLLTRPPAPERLEPRPPLPEVFTQTTDFRDVDGEQIH